MNPLASRLACAALSAVALIAPAHAQNRGAVALTVGEGRLLQLDEPAGTVFVANPQVADIQIAGPRSIFLFGAGPGRTTLFALNEQGAPIIERDIRVEHDLTALRTILTTRFPGADVTVTSAPNAIIVEGLVESPADAAAISAAVTRAVGDSDAVINRIQVATPMQVHLRVRVAEVSRSADRRLGVNWASLLSAGNFAFGIFTGSGVVSAATNAAAAVAGAATGSYSAATAGFNAGGVDINVLIDALNREGLARTLAEPNLTAMSGETASFTAGGEFPIPVAQDGGTLTIEFKQFGVILDFTPTVLSPDRISLRVRPEVSDLSANGAVEVNGISIPAITLRRVDTTVELASGQSLVIGGLLQQTARDQVDKVPGLGDLPVLGSLFTSTRYQNAETELIVTVTPYVVRPTRADALAGPVGDAAPGRSFEALLTNRAGMGVGAPPPRLHGPVGFVY
ncbi:MAG: type II and III secretion system protein family protein [Rubrimonas sp.]